VVVKASGLAAGKGVFVADTPEAARDAVAECLERRAFGEAGREVVIERCLTGEEVSAFAVTDGSTYRLLPAAQDHKRAYDDDRGPNTGGMGAYSPAPCFTAEVEEFVRRAVVERVLEGLRAEGLEYRGLLYAGLMLTAEGPRVLEFNVRFGDPETQAVLPRLGGDLGALLHAAARGELGNAPAAEPVHAAAACVVAAAADYPRAGSRGAAITGLEIARERGALVFHAGTAREHGRLVTAGGRVLAVTATGSSLEEAVAGAYRGVDSVHFEGMRFRTDIGRRALVAQGTEREERR
jgi:phosphoribosylamine--glycine ligase